MNSDCRCQCRANTARVGTPKAGRHVLRGYRVQHELSDYLLQLRAENENDLEQMHSIQSIGHMVRSCDTLPKVSEI